MKLLFIAIWALWTLTTLAQPVDSSFNNAGTFSYIVPAGYTAELTVSAWGGGGGVNGGSASRGGGGGGGFSTNTYTVGAGTYTIVVGDGGTTAAGGNSSYDFTGTPVIAGGGSPGLGSGGGPGGVGNSANGGQGGIRVNAGGGGGGGAAACITMTIGANGMPATTTIGGAGGVGCTDNPGNDGTGGNGGNVGISGSNGLLPGGGAGGKGENGASNGNGGRGRVIVTVNSALPIVLGEFTLSAMNDLPLLRWSTVSEINNDYFIVEKSKDGRYFSEVERIKGAGNSSNENIYQVVDKSPFVGLNYYRLRQVDYDGKVQTFKTLSTSYDLPINRDIVMVQRSQWIDINTVENQMDIRLYNYSGTLIDKSTHFGSHASIDLSNYTSGLILVKVTSGLFSKTFLAYR